MIILSYYFYTMTIRIDLCKKKIYIYSTKINNLYNIFDKSFPYILTYLNNYILQTTGGVGRYV